MYNPPPSANPNSATRTSAIWTKHRNAKHGIVTIVVQNEGNVQQRLKRKEKRKSKGKM
jgi:hypothetical protein